MSQFTKYTHLIPPQYGERLFTLGEPLSYERHYEGSGDFVTVPKGFKTNFASLPWIITLFIKPYDPRIALPSVVHDYQWTGNKTLEEYQEGNRDFYDGMIACGMPQWIAKLFFLGVSISKYFYRLSYLLSHKKD